MVVRIATALMVMTAVGGQDVAAQPKIVTVCEALRNPKSYANSAIAVVGRLEVSASLADRYEFLTEDLCQRPPNSRRHIWAYKIQVWSEWEEGMPKPRTDRPKLDRKRIAAKLSVVRRSTVLGTHEEPRFKIEANSITYSKTVAVPNKWAVAYGRLIIIPDDDAGGESGNRNVQLGLIVGGESNITILDDDGAPIRSE